MPNVTLRDIARLCGLDTSTVSRAMRGDARIRPATRERVTEAAQRLGYRPNLAARALVDGRSRTIWFLLPTFGAAVDWRAVHGASIFAGQRDYDLFAVPHNDEDEHYERVVGRLAQGLADGALIIPRRGGRDDQRLLRDLALRDFPVVFLDNYVEDLPVPVVTTDNEGACRELVRRCVEDGAEELVLLFGDENPVLRARRAGARSELEQQGIPYADTAGATAPWVPTRPSACLGIVGSGQEHLHRFASEHAADLRGRRVVMGCFDDWVGEPSPAERVFVAVQDSWTLAEKAVARLVTLIEGGPADSGERITRVPAREYRVVSRSF